MKNSNLLNRLLSYSHEKQKPQRFGRYAAMLILLLTLGVGQMWADPWVKLDVSTGSQGTKTVGDAISGSDWWFNYQTNGGWSTGTDIQVLIGTSTSSYSTVDASWYADDGSNKKVHANIGSFEFDKSGIWYAVGKYTAGGTTAYTSGTSFTNNTSLSTSMSKSNSPYWTVNPPAVSSFSVARSGYLAGSGTSEDPYLVASGSTLTLTGSGSQAISDANSSVNYKFGSDAYSTTATKNIIVTSSGSIDVKARCINSSASLNGTETSAITIYYAPVSVKDISVYIYVGGRSDAEAQSVEINSYTPYVGETALAAGRVNTYNSGSSPKFTKDGDWLSYTFEDVTKITLATCARAGGNIFTSLTLTDDIYYKYDGTPLSGKCIARTTPTWNVAPANGAAGGSMTATINNVPDGATVTWSSSATSYATVDNGYITYEAAGSATISARIQKAADGDYCALDETIYQAITVTSGATVTATRTCPAYVSTGAGEVTLDITSTGASSGWYYRIKNKSTAGYYAPDNQSAASNALSWTMTGGIGAELTTLVVELYNGSNTLICTSSDVTVTGEVAHITYIAAGSNGSVSPTTIYANNNHVHPSITATPNEHYHFVNWKSSNAAASVASTTSATTTVTATAGGYTITANFEGDQYTITYKDKDNAAYSGNNSGSLPATHTYGTATALVNGTKTGYDFAGWYTNPECTGDAVTSIGATSQTGNFTLYAKWTEKLTTVTVNVSPASSGTLTVGGAAFTPGNTTTAGVATSHTVVATPTSGKVFHNWTVTGNATGSASTNTYTLEGNGNAGTGTLTANFGIASGWYMYGNAPWGNTWNKSDATAQLTYPYRGMSGVYYIPTTIAANKYFRITDKSKEYNFSSNTGSDLALAKGTIYTLAENSSKATYSTSNLGSVWVVMNTNGTKKAWVQDPQTFHNVNVTGADNAKGPVKVTLKTTSAFTKGDNVFETTQFANGETFYVTITGVSGYIPTITIGGTPTTWWKEQDTYTASGTMSTSDIAVTISYTPTRAVRFAKTTGCETLTATGPSSTSVSDNTKIKDGTVITFHQENSTGYSFSKWYSNNTGTSGTEYSTDDGDFELTVSSTRYTIYPIYTENMTTVNLVASPTGKGTFTSGGNTVTSVSAGVTTHPSVTAVPATGYRVNTSATVWSESSDYISLSSTTTNPTTITATGTSGNSATLTATFTPHTYQVQFHRNGGAGDVVYQDFTYDAAQALTANTYTKTGYNFAGWATAADGSVVYADEANVSNLTATNNGTYHLYAKWTPNPYTVTLDIDEPNHGVITEKTTSQSVTYDAVTTTVPALPTAADGYALDGYYTDQLGEGTKVINGNGTWIASVDGYTDEDAKWVHVGDVTLYAYYKKAAITGITLSSGTVLPEGAVTATVTIDPTPTPTTIVCWKLLYNNGTLFDPQPTFTPGSGNEVSFAAPEASGTYKVQAQLRTGSTCGAGTLLSENETSFVVAGTHNVTIQYKCDGVNVKASTVVEGVKPLEWSETITPGDEPFGYTFARWEAGDGVSITDDDGASTKTTTTSSSIKIKAIYDGRLTAVYTQKQMIYFKNTLGWSDVYVNFYTASDWDNTDNGSGSPKGAGNKNVTNRNKHMTQIDDTDIWYFDYGYNEGGSSISPSLYVSFTSASQENVDEFWASSPGIGVVYPANYADAISTDKSSENGFKAATPMFVPISQEPVEINVGGSGKANYYNRGYWTTYTAGTGYTLEIYNSDGSSHIKSIAFTSDNDLMPMNAVTDLEAGKDYKYQIRRGGTESNGVYYGNSGTMTYANHGVGTGWEMTNTMEPFSMAGITTTAAGDYTFNLSYSANASSQYRLRMEVGYPIADGDYRVIYTDNTRSGFKPSAIVTKAANHKDTVSFFIRPKSSPVMKIQQSSVTNEGVITWNDLSTITSEITDARCPKDSVYNICLTMNESGAISVENIEGYDGNFYIRTDAANSKWDNYRASDHEMTYSEYAEKKTGSDYTHYWMAHVYANANVKFVIANDYSPCISDTLIQQTARGGDATHVNSGGDIQAEANIRYMWDMRNNAVMRAYLAPAQTDGSKFLVLQGQEGELLAPNGDPLAGESEAIPGNNHGGGANAIQFTDKENWMYDAEVQAVPGGRVKLYAVFHGSTFYYYGDNNASFDDPHAIDLIGGSGDAQNIRVVYDFKTDRLIAAWVPSDGDISIKQTINADIMLIREHQNAGKQINLTGTGSISTDKTVYGVMRFNRWTLNNKSTAAGHAVLPVGEQKSQYERFNYMISFPFDVKVGEIFGFGTIGRHYRIYYYDGLGRAKEGFFAERGDDNWRMIDDTDSILHANQGYLLQLNYIRMADDNTSTWPQASMNEVELYFPAMNEINTIKLEDVVIPALGDAYKCKINLQPTYHALNNPDSVEADRRVKDSYWRCIGVPGFTSYEANAGTWENFNWETETDSLPYLYEWQMDDNKLSVVSSSTFTFKPMHAYLIQNGKSFTWKSVAHPTLAAAPRRSAAEEGFYEFYLEMQNGEQALDHTYIRLTDKENITADFDFGQDLSKELNSGANIFTKVGYERLAANNLPLSEQTTIVPVGVKIAEEGNYTFAMPEGTHGVGVTLVDNETGDRTNLSLFDYSVNLTKGDYDNRFILEISPIQQMPTDIDNVQGESAQSAKARKVMIDGILYIVKDGKVFDAQGKRVQ